MRSERSSALLNIFAACLIAMLVLLLASCGGGGGEASASSETPADPESTYEVPEFWDAVYDESSAQGNSEVLVDLSGVDEGYFALVCNSDAKTKLQVFKGDEVYTYDVVLGKEQIFPLQMGNGTYTIKVMKNIVDTKYSELYCCTAEVDMADEFDPFLRPSQYADYDESSDCVKKAAEIAASSADGNGFITGVYDYVCKNITYDKKKAENIQSGYIPDPDSTLSEGKGICFDYASLAASMLRSQGIPTKIIFGYVGDSGDLYHAWNMYYTEESGWVAVEFEVSEDEWNRLDLTFSANGSDSRFIGDGSNYLDVYQF
jgi:hypothetical protein